jgi:hypothetical protein
MQTHATGVPGEGRDGARDREASRRRALATLGLAIGTAYLAPTVLHLDRAKAGPSGCQPGQHWNGKKCV